MSGSSNLSAVTRAQARDPDYFPGYAAAIPLGIQHVLAMFVSNLTPPIIIAGAAGFGFGSADPSALIYMIQMSMLFAGLATLLQTVGLGPIGARLPLVQGTSFAYIPIMIPIVAGQGVGAMAALTTAALICGLVHACLSVFVGRIRFALPPLITGLVVLMIGLSLMRIGVQYSAGGVPAIGTPAFGAMPNTTFSQNVGLIAITGMMSRHVVTLGAVFLIVCGLIPKIGALVTTIPIEVLGGGVIVMFGMVASAALAMLAAVDWNQRNMLVFGVSLSLALGLQLEPAAVAHLPETARVLLTSGVLPAAVMAVVLNLVLPRVTADEEMAPDALAPAD